MRSQERVPTRSLFDRCAQALDVIYRFLASLKLAVFSLATLVATLAYATCFESWYGGVAGLEWIYRSPGFAILLAFLGMNILCAALIRFPWKGRQTGFVITHAGLLILLAGSWISVRTADEGQLGMLRAAPDERRGSGAGRGGRRPWRRRGLSRWRGERGDG